MYALRRSFEHPDKWLNPFASTAGLVFLGTPFRGRHSMPLSDMIKAIKEAHPGHQIWQETMDMSVPENEFLTETVHRFLETRVSKGPIPIWCFYENLPSPMGKVLRNNELGTPKKKVCSIFTTSLSKLALFHRFKALKLIRCSGLRGARSISLSRLLSWHRQAPS